MAQIWDTIKHGQWASRGYCLKHWNVGILLLFKEIPVLILRIGMGTLQERMLT